MTGSLPAAGTQPTAGAPAGSRRDLLRQAAVGAAALSVPAALLRPSAALAQAAGDEDLREYLEQAIALEHAGVLGYSTAAGSDRLPGALPETVERFGTQEQEHADALRAAIDQLGFDPPPAPESAADTAAFEVLDEARAERVTQLLERLEGSDGAGRLVEALIGLETEQLRFYLGEAPALDSEDLTRTSAEIAGCQAQHLVVLREQRGGAPAEAASIPMPE